MKIVVEKVLCRLLVEYHNRKITREGMIEELVKIGCGEEFAATMVDAQIEGDADL